MRVLVAGATGAVGKQLVPQLIAAGHQVTATTRSPGKVPGLQAAGADAAVVDGLDAVGIGEAVAKAEPEVVIHQMTALSDLICGTSTGPSPKPTSCVPRDSTT